MSCSGAKQLGLEMAWPISKAKAKPKAQALVESQTRTSLVSQTIPNNMEFHCMYFVDPLRSMLTVPVWINLLKNPCRSYFKKFAGKVGKQDPSK